MPPETRFRDAHTLHRVEPTPNGEKTSQLLRRNTEQEVAKAQRLSGSLVGAAHQGGRS
jgi:hypothetical protein